MTTSASVHSVQTVQAESQTQKSVQPLKTLQTQDAAKQNQATQDSVTISQQARQALANSTTQAGGGGRNDSGNTR